MEGKAIENHLLGGEKILTSVKSKDQTTGQEVTFYATNKRVLRHAKRFRGEKVDTLSYPHIASVTFESKSYLPEGIAAMVVGVLSGYGLSRLGVGDISWIIGLVGVLVGIALCFYKTAWYQLRATGLSSEDLKLWRVIAGKAPEVRNFVRIVEEQITKGE